MLSITIITIVVIAFLTLIIFGLTWLGYSSCLKAYRLEVLTGKHDKEIIEMYTSKKKWGWAWLISSCLILILLLFIFFVGLSYKIKNENIVINNKTILVIKSDSMADFYNESIAEEWNNDRSLQFSIGDICVFEQVKDTDELIRGEVYGYKRKNIIVTHRLVDIRNNSYRFKGDNNPVDDGYSVEHSSVLYHYTGQKIRGLGCFILYAQSYFGLWSLICMIIVLISSEIVSHKIDKINKQRYQDLILGIDKQEEKIDNTNIEIPHINKKKIKRQKRTLIKDKRCKIWD